MPALGTQNVISLLQNVGIPGRAQQTGLIPTVPLEQQAQRPRQIPQLQSVLEATRQQPTAPSFDITIDEIMAPTQEELLADREGARKVALLAKFFPQQVEPIEEQLRRETLFPGGVGARQIGTVSGKIIGTQPIVVGGGGIFPLGIVQARQKALGDAAKRKKALKNKIFENAFAKGAVQIQDQLDDLSFRTLEKWAGIFKNDFSQATDLSNPAGRKMFQELQGLQTLGAETIELDKAADAIMNDAVDKEKFIPDDILKTALAYNEGTFNLQQFMEDPKGFAKIRDKLKNYSNMVNVVRTEILPQLQSDVDFVVDNITQKDIEIIMTTNDYDVVREVTKKYVPQGRVDSLAKFTKSNFTVFQPEKDIGDFIANMVGVQIQSDVRIGGKFNEAARRRLQQDRLTHEKELQGQTIFTTFANRTLTDNAATNNLVGILDKKFATPGDQATALLGSFETQAGVKSINSNLFIGNIPVSAEAFGDQTVTEIANNLHFSDKETGRAVSFATLKNNLIKKKAAGETLSEQEEELIEKDVNDDIPGIAITKMTAEWSFVNKDGALEILSPERLQKNPELAGDIVPTATVWYRAPGLPKAFRKVDLTRLGGKEGLDAMITKMQTQFRFGEKQKGATGFRPGEEEIIFE